jgi:predicted TIM-barrel fold metal-dependent hydrolase
MELPDFLRKFADPDIREELPLVSYGRSIVTDEEVEVIMSNGAQHSDEHKQSLIALGDRMITEVKEIQALGSFDKHDRVVANDMLGFIKQLVFATHSLHMPFSPSSKIPDRLRYGGARAHNRHMIDFCSVDERLMGVAAIPLENPELALEEVKFAVDGGLQAMWIPHRLAGERSPTHVDYNPIWALLQEAEIPVVFHVGGNPLQLPPAWSNTGRGVTRDWMGGGENVRARDAAVLHQGIETFVSMFVLDGVLEEFPRLKLASVELGAGWVPELLVRLDQIHKAYSTTASRASLVIRLSKFVNRWRLPHSSSKMLVDSWNIQTTTCICSRATTHIRKADAIPLRGSNLACRTFLVKQLTNSTHRISCASFRMRATM